MEQIGMPDEHLPAGRQKGLGLQAKAFHVFLPDWFKEALGMGLVSHLLRSQPQAGGRAVGQTVTTWIVKQRSTIR